METSVLTPGSNAFSSALPPSIAPPPPLNLSSTGIATATNVPPPPPPPSPTKSDSSPPATPTSSSSSSSSPSSSPSSSTTTTPESSTSKTQSSDPPTITTSSMIGTDSAILSTSTPTSNPISEQPQGNLTTGQIIGIALAGVAIFAFLLGLIWFLRHRRNQKLKARRGSRWSETADKPSSDPFPPGDDQLERGISSHAATTRDSGQRFYASNSAQEEKRRSFWRKSIKPEDIGVAVSPEIAQASSPTSVSSQRTTSQLLPALPNYSLWPAPLRKSQQHSKSSHRTPQRPPPVFTFPSTFVQPNQTPKGSRVVSSRTGNGLPTDPRAQMRRVEESRKLYGKIPLTPIYDNGNFSTIGVTQNSTPSSAMGPQTSFRPLPELPPGESTPNTRLAPVVQPSLLPSLQITGPDQRQLPPLRRNSSASDSTTFEDDEDVTPEESNAQLRPTPLSPVVESPRRLPEATSGQAASPLSAGLIYPILPRSAAISRQAERQPRARTTGPSSGFARASADSVYSQPAHRDQSPSSLLAKRKGDRAAEQMLQQGLRISSTSANVGRPRIANTQGPQMGWSRTQNEENNGIMGYQTAWPSAYDFASSGLKSPPIQDTKLTPTKRGDDLYLSVE